MATSVAIMARVGGCSASVGTGLSSRGGGTGGSGREHIPQGKPWYSHRISGKPRRKCGGCPGFAVRSPEGETSMSHCFDCALLIVRNLSKSGAKKVRQVCLTSPPIAVGGGAKRVCPPDYMLRHGGVSTACWRKGRIRLGYCWRVT